jgi:hypothetical protein
VLVVCGPQLTRELEAAGALSVPAASSVQPEGDDPAHDLAPPRARSIRLMVDASRSTADEQLTDLSLTEEEKLVLAKVADILRKIQFGTVVLVVQDSKVVQVEMAEKFRLR